MKVQLINIGFGNIVSANRIIAIVSPESAPIKRIIQDARDRGMLIDATYGRRTRAVIIADSDHVILSAVQPETVAHRMESRSVDGDNDKTYEDEFEDAEDAEETYVITYEGKKVRPAAVKGRFARSSGQGIRR